MRNGGGEMSNGLFGQIDWYQQGAQFEFDSNDAANRWVASGAPVNFVFALDTADNSERIFGIEDAEIENVTLLETEYKFRCDDNVVTINAAHSFPVDLADGISIEDFENWIAEEGGSFCGVIEPISDEEVSPIGFDESGTTFTSIETLTEASEESAEQPARKQKASSLASGLRTSPRYRRLVMRVLAVLPVIWFLSYIASVLWGIPANPVDSLRWLLWIAGILAGLFGLLTIFGVLGDLFSAPSEPVTPPRLNKDGTPDQRFKGNW